jgi:IS30 family transposase
MAQHARLRCDIGLAIDLCDPHSPWKRGTNENTNGLLRQYFPKGTQEVLATTRTITDSDGQVLEALDYATTVGLDR